MGRSRRVIAFSVPVDRWYSRSAIRAGNALLCARSRKFQGFVHPPRAMIAALADEGFTVRHDRAGLAWRTIVAVR